MKKIKVRTYKKSGDKDDEFYFHKIHDALKKYVELRNNIPDFKNHMEIWPTIWINTDNGFRRVHEFAYAELTEESVAKYLEERIIETDDLLATI